MKRAILIFSKMVSYLFLLLGGGGTVYFTYAFFTKISHPALALVVPVFIFVSLVLLAGGVALYFVNRMLERNMRAESNRQ